MLFAWLILIVVYELLVLLPVGCFSKEVHRDQFTGKTFVPLILIFYSSVSNSLFIFCMGYCLSLFLLMMSGCFLWNIWLHWLFILSLSISYLCRCRVLLFASLLSTRICHSIVSQFPCKFLLPFPLVFFSIVICGSIDV